MTEGRARTVRCPVCGSPAGLPPANRTFPFCREACRMVDLGRWMNGAYALDPSTGRLDVIDPAEAVEVGADDGSDGGDSRH